MANTWYIVQTNPNCEVKAAGEIRRAGFRVYLPKRARLVWHHRQKAHTTPRRPALVGYLFVRFPDGRTDWYALRQCQGVKGVLYSDGRPYAVPQQTLVAIVRDQRAMSYDEPNARTYRRGRLTGERNALTREKFKEGMQVARVGVADRLIAQIIRVTERGTIQAVTEMMGREVTVEFTEADELEILDETAEAA